ncbi:hypothetical protein GFS03_04735 [Sulfolobus sp. E5-1-F]|uniref:hypothetical protein n=1 Tax=Saccharolobus sp. E5-1-F TaxID=2663019 RepID=UPI00129690CB|nr:hypothetical protein [Sulfolobus sp. E5-1-F]QGA53930.1 hypothetical protein GFS03_04735 [Sulfolobus sp. E5-1-F]
MPKRSAERIIITLNNLWKFKNLLLSQYVRQAILLAHKVDVFTQKVPLADEDQLDQFIKNVNILLEALKAKYVKLGLNKEANVSDIDLLKLEKSDFDENNFVPLKAVRQSKKRKSKNPNNSDKKEILNNSKYRLEFSEYGRIFGGQTSAIRNIIGVNKAVAKLARIGDLSTAVDEGNVFIDIVYPERVLFDNIEKALDYSKEVIRKRSEKSKLSEKATLMGVASAYALAYMQAIEKDTQYKALLGFIYFDRSSKDGSSKDGSSKDGSSKLVYYYITDLMKVIWKLKLANSIYMLTSKYRYEEDDSNAIRTLIELLSNAIIQYINVQDVSLFYPIIRGLTSNTVNIAGEKIYGNEWKNIKNDILGIYDGNHEKN